MVKLRCEDETSGTLRLRLISALSRATSPTSRGVHHRLACVRACHGGVFQCFDRNSKMPKMKTKSAAKKRFKVTASGRVKAGAAGKRHGMIKRTKKQIRNQRGTMVLAPGDERLVKIHMPYLAK
jgi:large subunit ribosomal protein L35